MELRKYTDLGASHVMSPPASETMGGPSQQQEFYLKFWKNLAWKLRGILGLEESSLKTDCRCRTRQCESAVGTILAYEGPELYLLSPA